MSRPPQERRLLTRALAVVGRPVVTVAGEDIAQIKDVVFTPGGDVEGFTLAGRGMFSGPLKEWLPWSSVHGFGPDAVIVQGRSALMERKGRGKGGDVVGDDVLTRSGTIVGTVVDAVLRLEDRGLDLVGYEVEPSTGEGTRFVPLPDTIAVTEGRLVVPDQAMEFLANDLAGFAAAVDSFRSRLQEGQS